MSAQVSFQVDTVIEYTWNLKNPTSADYATANGKIETLFNDALAASAVDAGFTYDGMTVGFVQGTGEIATAWVAGFYSETYASGVTVDTDLNKLWIISQVEEQIKSAILASDGTVVATTTELATPTAEVALETVTVSSRRRRRSIGSSKLKTILLFQALTGQSDLGFNQLMPFILLNDEEDNVMLTVLLSMIHGGNTSQNGNVFGIFLY